jgi:hypothetical protein
MPINRSPDKVARALRMYRTSSTDKGKDVIFINRVSKKITMNVATIINDHLDIKDSLRDFIFSEGFDLYELSLQVG